LALDDLLPDDHRARAVWEYVERLDLSSVYAAIRAVEGHAGRSPIDPKILMALWLYATLEGVGSARQIARLVETDAAYQWICGGVGVNHHTISDFRCVDVELLSRLLSESVAALTYSGLVSLKRVAHDGMRTRASAGRKTFRREKTVERHMREAREQVEALRKELEADPALGTKRERAARERAVRERKERLERAREEVKKAQKSRHHGKKRNENARCSSTDPEARIMRMPNGGYDPAYNVQVSVATDSHVIVGVDVRNEGSDGSLLEPAVEQLESRYEEEAPEEILVDGGFVGLGGVKKVLKKGMEVYAPLRDPTDPDREKGEPTKKDTKLSAAWRQRMETEEAKSIYKERASTIECVNAHLRRRGLTQFLVRGLRKTKAVALWHALAHNLERSWSLSAPTLLEAR
jgi:transposase